MLTVYDTNPTMKLLGKQKSMPIFWQNDEVCKEIREISEAKPFSFSIESAADIFMLGYIHGKRADRARRKANK